MPSLPDVYVRLVLQQEERTLAVLPLHGHVQQGLPVRHGVVDASAGPQQLSCDRVHAWETSRSARAQLSPVLHLLTTTHAPSQRQSQQFPLGITGLTPTERLSYNQVTSSTPSTAPSLLTDVCLQMPMAVAPPYLSIRPGPAQSGLGNP